MRNIILATSLFTALPVVAEDCDCQHVVGQCTGAIDFVKAYGSAPSYGRRDSHSYSAFGTQCPYPLASRQKPLSAYSGLARSRPVCCIQVCR